MEVPGLTGKPSNPLGMLAEALEREAEKGRKESTGVHQADVETAGPFDG